MTFEEVEADYNAKRDAWKQAKANHESLKARAEDAHEKRKATYAAFLTAEKAYRKAKHIADGFCAGEVREGDTWHPVYTLCKLKAKENGYCGRHKRQAN